MRAALLLIPLLLAGGTQGDDRLGRILDRLSEEAAVFANAARKVIGQETLRQRARVTTRRFRLRVGSDAVKPPPPQYREREIVSEYGFSVFRESPASLHEVRKVVTVDGKPVTAREKARETLTLGVTSDDDRLKKKMLLEFQKYGLTNAVVDFGQLILLFPRRELPNYRFEIAGERQLGAEKVLVLSYKQAAGTDSLTIYEGKQAIREPLSGEIWVRDSDYLPLRVTVNSSTEREDKRITRHRAEVDYFPSAYGVLLPVSVRYEKLVDEELMVENVCRYSAFNMFSVDAEIKFEPEKAEGAK